MENTNCSNREDKNTNETETELEEEGYTNCNCPWCGGWDDDGEYAREYAEDAEESPSD
jgi:hypothetical protein